MSRHTPGPWALDSYSSFVFAGQMQVCEIRGWGHLTGAGALNLDGDAAEAIMRANGRLIAAAPDLLAAAVAFVESWDVDDSSVGLRAIAELRAAIAKAEGR